MTILRVLRPLTLCYGEKKRVGDTIEYTPWPHDWQGMSEPDRVSLGIYVHCFGMGEFDVFRLGDVEVDGVDIDAVHKTR